LREYFSDRSHRLAPFAPSQLDDPGIGFTLMSFRESSPIVRVNAITVSATASPLVRQSTPERRVRAHFVGVNALAHQLGLAHQSVETTLQDSYRLFDQCLIA